MPRILTNADLDRQDIIDWLGKQDVIIRCHPTRFHASTNSAPFVDASGETILGAIESLIVAARECNMAESKRHLHFANVETILAQRTGELLCPR